MKTQLLPLSIFLLCYFCSFSQIYVDNTASDGGNGSSWASAYNDLQDALLNAQMGDTLYVAEGTYLPAEPNGDPTASFSIAQNMILLGGFPSGGDLNDRNPELFPTILSGDLNGDDMDNDFVNYKSDNVLTVVTVNEAVTNDALIDGFIIQGGHANDLNGPTNPQHRGGGLYSTGNPILKNCVFEQNFADLGGGAHFQPNSGVVTVQVENCTFRSNRSRRGAGLNMHNIDCVVSDCDFESNFASQHGGGLRYSGHITNRTVEIYDCWFENNAAAFGGGLRYASQQDFNSIHIEGCVFTNNRTEEYSGWVQGGAGAQIAFFDEDDEIFNNSITIKKCLFDQNTTGVTSGNFGDGGGLSLQTLNSINTFISVDSCSFFNNEALKFGGSGRFRLGGRNEDVHITNCSFEKNTAQIAAALDISGENQEDGNAMVENCQFIQNSSSYRSGAIYLGSIGMEGAPMTFQVQNSTFTENQAEQGGAIGLWNSGNSPVDITLMDCTIEGNIASSLGGAIFATPSSDNLSLLVDRGKLMDNTSPSAGAIDAVYNGGTTNLPSNYNIQIENSLIAGDSGSGAAIRTDFGSRLNLLNTTIADYNGGSIQLTNQSMLTLQNTILSSPDAFTISDLTGDATILSNGGNLFTDQALGNNAHSTDQVNTDPMFVNPGNKDYRLQHPESPGIGKGIHNEPSPEFDLDGNDRVVGCIDIGAFEHPDDTSMDCITDTKEISLQKLEVFPNPVSTLLQIDFPEQVIYPVTISIEDINGKTLKNQMIQSGEPVDVSDLISGMYFLSMEMQNVTYLSKFVKM